MFAGLLNRALLLRPGETRLVLYLGGLAVLFGLGLALGRGSSDALFLKRFGVEHLPKMYLAGSLLLLLASAFYSRLVERHPPGQTLHSLARWMAIFLGVNGGLMLVTPLTGAFAAYFLFYLVASEVLLLHFNFYVTTFFDAQQGKRLFPVIQAATRLGAIFGGLSLSGIVRYVPATWLSLAWAALLLASMAALRVRQRDHPETRRPARASAHHQARFAGLREAWLFAGQNSLMRMMALGLFCLMVLVCLQEFVVSRLFNAHFEDEADLTAFFGHFFALSNAVVMLLQLGVTNRLLRRFGLRFVNLIYPVSTLLSFALLALAPGFLSAIIGRFNYQGMMPAFRTPAAGLFFHALPGYMQGRARAVMLGLVIPAALASSGALLMALPGWSNQALARLGLAIAAVFLLFKIGKNIAYSEHLIELIRQQVFSDKTDPISPGLRIDRRTARRIALEIPKAPDDDTALAYADLIVAHARPVAGRLLLDIAPSVHPHLQDRLFAHLLTLKPRGWLAYARGLLAHPDKHLAATALAGLARLDDPAALDRIPHALADDSPRLRATAARLQLERGEDKAWPMLEHMLQTSTTAERIAALQALRGYPISNVIPTAAQRIAALLQAPDGRVRAAALRTALAAPMATSTTIVVQIEAALSDEAPSVRIAAAQALHEIAAAGPRLALLARLLIDPAPEVRRAALHAAPALPPLPARELSAALRLHFMDFALHEWLLDAAQDLPDPERRPLLEDLAQQHIDAASAKQALMHCPDLKGPRLDAPGTCLRWALQEEAHQHCEAALLLLATSGHGDSLRRLIPALRSPDRMLRAQAIESLLCHPLGTHGDNLVQLLDPSVQPDTPPPPTAQLINAVQRRASHWLNDCLQAWQARRQVVAEAIPGSAP